MMMVPCVNQRREDLYIILLRFSLFLLRVHHGKALQSLLNLLSIIIIFNSPFATCILTLHSVELTLGDHFLILFTLFEFLHHLFLLTVRPSNV